MLKCKYRKTGNFYYITEYKRVGNQVNHMTRKAQRKNCCSVNIERQEMLIIEQNTKESGIKLNISIGKRKERSAAV